MSKPEWGLKRVCQSCGSHFYDMKRNPIECPKCKAIYDPEAVLKSRRPRLAPEPVKAALPKDEIELPEVDLGDGEDDSVIEDTSELGEDDEDVAEVIEDIEEEDR